MSGLQLIPAYFCVHMNGVTICPFSRFRTRRSASVHYLYLQYVIRLQVGLSNQCVYPLSFLQPAFVGRSRSLSQVERCLHIAARILHCSHCPEGKAGSVVRSGLSLSLSLSVILGGVSCHDSGQIEFQHLKTDSSVTEALSCSQTLK